MIQAARDDVWLSRTMTLKVSAKKPLPPLRIDIAKPGRPLMVHCVSPNGRNAPGVRIRFGLRGPLRTKLWPKNWRTDGAGNLYVPCLSAGKAVLRLSWSARTAEATGHRRRFHQTITAQVQSWKPGKPQWMLVKLAKAAGR